METKPAPKPRMSPAPFDCSNRKVREANDPVAKAHLQAGDSN
jgi:hypothetical protein